MLVHFWGVRGSLPSPLTAEQVQNKIIAAIERITPKDLESQDSKTKFISSLPDWIFGTVGGNTACVEVRSDEEKRFIIDCGSGLRVFAKNGTRTEDKHYNILLSHFHWDHIQGLPFFDAAFDPESTFDIYSAYPAAERILMEQSRPPYFPVNGSWNAIKDRFTFHLIRQDEPFYADGVKITAHKMNHPGNSYSFSLEENGKKFIYASDVELKPSDFDHSIPRNSFFESADLLVLDAQYNSIEAVHKQNWGHNSYASGVDFADCWKTKKLYFFHHEPTYDDQKIYKMLQNARWYAEYRENCNVDIELAVEGQEVEL